MLSEIRWPVATSWMRLDVRTLELDPGGYAALDILGRADVMVISRTGERIALG